MNEPIPTNKTNREKYAFSTFEVSESRFYATARSKVSAAVTMFCKRSGRGKKFKTSIVETGTKVWRIV